MAELSIEQKRTIDAYRNANKLEFVISDSAIFDMILKEMQTTGKVYEGFESLANSVAQKRTTKEPTNQATTNTASNLSIWGNLIIEDDLLPTFSQTATNQTLRQPTAQELVALDFLARIINEGQENFDARELENGPMSEIVNVWKERFDKEYARSTVRAELNVASKDLAKLQQAANGELTYFDLWTGSIKSKDFAQAFKEQRGVEFNFEAINDCLEKSEQFAAIKTSVEMINQTKQILGCTTKGDVNSQMDPQGASSAIIKAFQLSGINSLKEMNKTLHDIEQKYQNHPSIQKYGGGFKFAKNKQGKYVIYRIAKNGYPAEATNEQLRDIAKEMGLRLDKALATALGVEYSKNATPEEMANLTQQTYDKYQKEYEESFAKAYGKKDVKALAEAYVLKQQKGVANIEMGINIASMALMVIPGGTVAATGLLSKVAAGTNYASKVQKVASAAIKVQSSTQKIAPLLMTTMTVRPIELVEQLISENGMSADEWRAWGQGILQNTVYMTVGMGVSKVAEFGAAMYKTKALVETFKTAGKSFDEIQAMIKANPLKFPDEIVKSMTRTDALAKGLQISSEAALDYGSTIMLNKAMGNENLPQDVIYSIVFALNGGLLQKQFMPLSQPQKIDFLMKELGDYGITERDAFRILEKMDEISKGEVRLEEADNTNNITTKKDTRFTQARHNIEKLLSIPVLNKNSTALKLLSAIQNNEIPSTVRDLYSPIIEKISQMTTDEIKQYQKYLKDYSKKENIELWQYTGKDIFLSKTLSVENLKNLEKYANLVQQNKIGIKYAKHLYHKDILGINIIKPEYKYNGEKEELTEICTKQENVIKEIDKTDDIDFFCKESFDLLKSNMGLEDSGIELKFVTGNKGGYYDVTTNTVYINKKWTSSDSKISEQEYDKAEIFGALAHELTHARQWIEIIRNGWLEENPAMKKAIKKSEQGKNLLYYTRQINNNEISLEKSLIDFDNWQNYSEPYKYDYQGNPIRDKAGNLIIDRKSKEYEIYKTQIVEREAFEIGDLATKKYRELTLNNSLRKISVSEIKALFNNNKIDTENHWYKAIEDILKVLRTDNYKVNLDPNLTAKDYEIIAMLVNLKDGEYCDIWNSIGEDGIPNIQKLALFVRTMNLTHQTLEYANFDVNQWEIVIKDIITKPQDLILPVLKYKIDSTEINNAISDDSYLNNPEMLDLVNKIESYLDLYTVKEPFIVYRGERSFNLFKTVEIENNKTFALYLDEINTKIQELYKQGIIDDSLINSVTSNLKGLTIFQKRFLSTAIIESSTEKYAEKVFWNLMVPSGTKGMSIESFNIERNAETEFLIKKNSYIVITDAKYDIKRSIWIIDGIIKQN